jgi:hypothetical protein
MSTATQSEAPCTHPGKWTVVNATGTVVAGTTPPGVAGNAAVVVTTPAGSANVASGFTYV